MDILISSKTFQSGYGNKYNFIETPCNKVNISYNYVGKGEM